MQTDTLIILEYVAGGMLLLVTTGVVYLTLSDWRDRRRREDAAREVRLSKSASKK